MTDPYAITDLAALREVYGEPSERAVKKQQDRLDDHTRRFIAMSPFVLMATASRAGMCDVSPKGGPPGFVRTAGDHRLVIPDARGNRRLDGLENLVENPEIGLVFLIPGLGETLRVNGGASLTTDPGVVDGLPTGGQPARLAIIVEVREAYIHCAKALIRSSLWDPETWPDRDELPSAAEILGAHIGISSLAESQAALTEGYTTRL